jgi:hypothetical protein
MNDQDAKNDNKYLIVPVSSVVVTSSLLNWQLDDKEVTWTYMESY